MADAQQDNTHRNIDFDRVLQIAILALPVIQTLTTKKKDHSLLIDNFVKVIVFVICAFLAWIATEVNSNTGQLIELRSQNNMFTSALKDIEDFTREPRYTERQGSTAIALRVNPIEIKVNEFDMTLKSHERWMDLVEKRVSANEGRYEKIKEDLKDIKELIQKTEQRQK